MRVKTCTLKGAQLDWAVAQAEGRIDLYIDELGEVVGADEFDYCTDWSQGGPIIDREKLCVGNKHQCDPNYCELLDPSTVCWARTTAGGHLSYGPTLLIAAMRCFCCSKLGDVVDIPEELCQHQNS